MKGAAPPGGIIPTGGTMPMGGATPAMLGPAVIIRGMSAGESVCVYACVGGGRREEEEGVCVCVHTY